MTHSYAFGGYVLRTDPRQLLHDGAEVRLGARSLALLQALVENHTRTLSKQQLLQIVWNAPAGNDNSVHVHINGLRNRIGRELIATVPGEGYRLNAPVRALGCRARFDAQLCGERVRLIGRDADAARLDALLDSQLLVTAQGPGGVGKTALAHSVVAGRQSRYADGVVWVDVGAIADPAQLAGAVAAAARLPLAGADEVEALRRQLAQRDMLLVLDTGEHLIGAVARFCAGLALSAGGLRVLVTSQLPLQIAGEWVLRLTGLDVSRPGAPFAEAVRSGAIALFVECCAQVQEGFKLTAANVESVARLCRLADGLPLAIGQLASRVPCADVGVEWSDAALWQPLTEGNARRDLPARQRTMAATLDWSLALLPPPLRDVTAQLAVFDASFTREAARAVIDAPRDIVDVSLDDLVRASLLSIDSAGRRFRMLTVARTYLRQRPLPGAAKLEPQATSRRRHADYYAALAAHGRAALDAEPLAYRDTIGEDEANYHAALDWALHDGASAAHALNLCADLFRFWDATGRFAEAGRYIAAARALPGADAPSLRPIRLRATYCGAVAELYQGHAQAAQLQFEEALALAQAEGDAPLRAWAQHGLGECAMLGGDVEAALAATQSALRHMQSVGDWSGVVACETSLALSWIEREDLAQSAVAAEAALAAARRSGVLGRAVFAHGVLGQVLWLRGDLEAARTQMQAALELATSLQARRPRAQALCGIANIEVDAGNLAVAARHFEAGVGALLQADLSEALAVALLGVARLLARSGQAASALRVSSGVVAHADRGRIHLSPYDRRGLAETGRLAALDCGPGPAEAARTRGLAAPLREVAEFALQELLRLASAPAPVRQRPAAGRGDAAVAA